VSWLTKLRADGQLREKHEHMAETGTRPPYLQEVYSSHRSLHREAERLAKLGYRVQSRRDMREADGYHVTFVYMGHQTDRARSAVEAGRRERF
jgi:hypothetical protein